MEAVDGHGHPIHLGKDAKPEIDPLKALVDASSVKGIFERLGRICYDRAELGERLVNLGDSRKWNRAALVCVISSTKVEV